MPTYFGQQTQTGNDDVGAIASFWTLANFACPGSGNQNIQELSAYVYQTQAVNIRLGVYTTAGVLVAEGTGEIAVVANGGAYAWQGHMTQASVKAAGGASPGVLVGGTSYKLALSCDYNGSALQFGYTGTNANDYYKLTDYTGGMPANLPASDGQAYQYCIRCGVEAAAGGLSILPTGISSGQGIGTHKLNRYLLPSGVASAQAFGTLKANRYLIPSGVATGQDFGTSKLNRYVTPTGVVSGQVFGTAKVNRYVIPAGVASGQSFGTSSISRNMKMTGLASGESWGTSKINRYLIPNGISSSEALGTAKTIFTISPSGILSSEVFGNASLGLFILPGGIFSGEAIGSHKLGVYVLPNGITSGESFGASTLNLRLLLNGIASGESFGTHQLNRFIIPSGVTSRESIGSHVVFSGAIYLLPSGIISSESFGQPQLNRFILATGIPSGESIGALSLSRWLLPSGIGSGEVFGGLSLSRFIVPSGIASSEIFGSHQFNFFILPSGIITAESIGAFIISGVGSQSVLPTGITSAEAFGSLVIPIPFNRDWNELKARIIYLLRNDTILRGLLNKSASPYGVYFIRPPEKPSFPVLTMRFIDEIMDVEKNPQPRIIHVEFKAYSATNSDAILERVEELINQSVDFTNMIEYKVANVALDSIGPDDFDVNFNIYTGSHRYIFFVDHHQLESWS